MTSTENSRKRRAPVLLRGLVGLAMFATGYVTAIASAPYATSINLGLVNAFDSVGKNLFGDAVFGAIPGNPVIPGNPIRIDIASDTRIPVAVGVFDPPNPAIPGDPCHALAQVAVTPGSAQSVALYYDANRVQPIAGIPGNPIAPNLARCPAPSN